jgi:glyoxylase-like metal-dependent hydrolase (beta-lactamase superfamily II)
MIKTEQYGEVTQIRMGRDSDGEVLYWAAAYLVDGLLIDTGSSHTAEELLTYLEDKRVDQAYITHYHEDHIGGCALLKQKLNLKIWAQPDTISLIKEAPSLHPYQELVWGYPDPADIQPLAEDRVKTENYSLQVVKTPGHSPDHSVLIEPGQGWCFSGDLFVSEKIKVLRPEEDIGVIIKSMKKLLGRDPDPGKEMTLFTSIGKVVPKGRKAIKACIGYLENLGIEARKLHYELGLSPEEIVERLFDGESSMAALTGDQFSSKNLVNSLLTMSP